MAENFDPCECICSPQWAVRRLISALRNSQQYCTDGECFTDTNPMQGLGPTPNEDSGMFYVMIAWIVVAALLFFLRPQSLRRPTNEKPRDNNGPGPDNLPPAVQ